MKKTPAKKTARKAPARKAATKKAPPRPVAPAGKKPKPPPSKPTKVGAPFKAGTKKTASPRTAGGRFQAKATGRPSKFCPAVLARIVAGLSEGIPLTILCAPEDMPCDDTVRNWMAEDETVFREIARARARGFDRIAFEAMGIAQDRSRDVISGGEFGDKPNTAAVARDKLIIDTRLSLLAKWDPKRYGAKVTTEIGGIDGKPLQVSSTLELSADQEARIVEAAAIAAALVPPACLDPAEAARGGAGA